MSFFKSLTSSNRGITIGLGFVKIVKVLISVVTIILSAKYFGTSVERDAWILGVTVIAVIVQLFFGPINETFRAKYIHIREEKSVEEADEMTLHLISGFTIICTIISLIIFIFPGIITESFAPGFSGAQKEVLVTMVKILVPSLLIIQITNIWSSMLNAYNSFYLPELFAFVSVILNVILLIALSPYIGIYSLVLSSYISSILLIIVIYRELNLKFKYKFRFIFPRFEIVKPFLIFSLPLYVNYLFSQADTVIEKALISTMAQGSISVVDYAKRFSDLSLTMIISVITTVLTPVLAYLCAKNAGKDIIVETQKYFRMMALIVIPLCVVFVVVPKEIITVLLLRGTFSVDNVETTSNLLRFYGLGIFFSTIFVIYSQLLIAQKRVGIYSIFLVSIFVVKIGLNYLLYKKFGLIIFPLSWGVAYFSLGTIFMFLSTKEWRKLVMTDGIKIYLILFLSIAINLSLYQVIAHYFTNIQLLVIFGVLIVSIELLLVVLFRVEEYKILFSAIKKMKERIK